MIYLKCTAACGDFDLCLIACPHNQRLHECIVPVCDCQREDALPDDKDPVIVVEEETCKG